MVDVDRLRAALAWAHEEAGKPEPDRRWLQYVWMEHDPAWTCGTRCCLAGNIALTAGWTPDPCPLERGSRGWWSTSLVRSPETGKVRFVDYVAAELLDIGPDDAGSLFSGSNNLRDLYEVAARLTGGAITVPDGPFPDEHWAFSDPPADVPC